MISVLLAALLWTSANLASAQAADSQSPVQSDVWVTSESTRAILLDIYLTNKREIEMGQLAASKAMTDKVRSYAERIVKDHKTANRMLNRLVDGKNIAVAERKKAEKAKQEAHAKHMAKLHSVSGLEFDHQFLEIMEETHKKSLANLKRFVDDQDLNQMDGFASDREHAVDLARKLTPILHQHLKLARHLENRIAKKQK